MSEDDMDDMDDDDSRCPRCCGAGWIEYVEAPELWGEDSLSEVNHLVDCPDCGGTGAAS